MQTHPWLQCPVVGERQPGWSSGSERKEASRGGRRGARALSKKKNGRARLFFARAGQHSRHLEHGVLKGLHILFCEHVLALGGHGGGRCGCGARGRAALTGRWVCDRETAGVTVKSRAFTLVPSQTRWTLGTLANPGHCKYR